MKKLREIFTERAESIVSGAGGASVMAFTLAAVGEPNEALRILSVGVGAATGIAATTSATLAGKVERLSVEAVAVGAGATMVGLFGLQSFVKPFMN